MAAKSTNIYPKQSGMPTAAAATDSFEQLHDYINLSENNISALYSSTTTTYTSIYNNDSSVNVSNGNVDVATPRIFSEIPFWLIPCYSIIFLSAIAGNFLVISTLIQNRRMRTITNVFLLNLAISDMLLGVLCMPVTLVGTLLRHFIFGEFFCKLIQFSQAASVAVSSWTLVAISCERYYAICHPLRSRTWQTINHAYRIIGFIWFGSIICMTPIAVFSQLMPTSRQGLRKCREQWPEDTIAYERSYNIFLVLVLLVLPLFILCVAYILITRTLYVGMRAERALIFGGNTSSHSITGAKLNDDNTVSTFEPIATMTTRTRTTAAATAAATVQPTILAGFNLRMSFRCHRRSASIGNCSIRSDDFDMTTPTQNNISYQQQTQCSHSKQLSQQRQLNYFDESGGGGSDIFPKSCSTSTSKSSQSLFGLQMLPCVELSAQQKQLEAQQLQQQQQHNEKQRQQSNTTNYSHCYNNNGNHSAMNNQSISILYSEQQQQQQENRCVLRANLPQYNCNHFQYKQHSVQQQNSMQAQQKHLKQDRRKLNAKSSLRVTESTLRRSNETKNLESKKRVVKMLFVLVLEFFICWTPLYVINTVAMFSGPAIYEYIDYTTICFFQLLAYSSSCCNPITYCFMNPNFRRAFLDNFKGWHFSSIRKAFGSKRTSVGVSSWHRRRRRTTTSTRVVSGSDKQLPTLVPCSHSISLSSNATAIILPNNNNNTSIQHDEVMSLQHRET